MTWTRDLAWKNALIAERSTTAYVLARFALALDYKALTPEVIHQAKRSLLDTIGCAMGAHHAPGRAILETMAQTLGGKEESTVIGSGLRTSAPNAALVNTLLIRFLDFNDIFGGAGHTSDALGAALAVAEREKTNGRDYLAAQVLIYEIAARCVESIGNMEGRGWAPDSMGALYVTAAVGKLMGLNEDQIANAIGICGCHELPLGILDTHREENLMSKNLRLGWTSYNAIPACILAKNGFSGPVRIVEGEGGINHSLWGNGMDFQKLFDLTGFRHLQTRLKAAPANFSTIGHVLATMALVKENNIKAEDVASVIMRPTVREALHCTIVPGKKYPRNGESADHSVFWTTAVIIRDHALGPDQYDPKNFTDPVVLDLIDKITVIPDTTLPTSFGGGCEITLKNGKVFKNRFEGTHGFGNDPLTDAEAEDKFKGMASKYLSARQMKQIIDTVWDLEKLDDMGKLMKLTVFPSK